MKSRPFLKGFLGLLILAILFWMVTLAIRLSVEKGASPFSWKKKIALIEIKGVILESETTLEQLGKIEEDDSVKGIVVRIDSGGGAVAPSQEIYRAINNLRKKNGKKVVASMGSVAASGGYYIACAADKVMANPGTMTGSIGVIMALSNVEELMKKVGMRVLVLKSGEHKGIGSPFGPLSSEERSILQLLLNDVHHQFIEAVALGRGMEVEAVRKLADGRIFTGRQAKELKLVDEIGGLQEAILLAARLAGIPGKPEVMHLRRPKGWFSWLLNDQTFGNLLPIPQKEGIGLGLHYLLPELSYR